MSKLEDWAEEATRSARWTLPNEMALNSRLESEQTPLANRRDRRLMLSCAAMAGCLGFAVTGLIETPFGKPTPARWPAQASSSSPSVLLVADGRR